MRYFFCMKRVLSGMQPSGNPHIGNYLGAMRRHVELSHDAEHECFYFVANYHALTTVRDGATLHNLTRELVLDYLALGLDTTETAFFVQSSIPELTELTWIFDCITSMGLLERAHAWKDARAKKKKEITVGLFNYPVLMAVDILIYKPDMVPVGKDQKQHVEMARDIAENFNNTFGETFKLPAPDIKEDVAVVPGTDGQKMSKSYGNVIEIFADEARLKEQVFSIKTDSKGVDEPKNPTEVLPYNLYAFFAHDREARDLAEKLKAGGVGYAEIKKKLFETLLDHFAKARTARRALEKNLDHVEAVLREGTRKARAVATATMDDVRKKVGLWL